MMPQRWQMPRSFMSGLGHFRCQQHNFSTPNLLNTSVNLQGNLWWIKWKIITLSWMTILRSYPVMEKVFDEDVSGANSDVNCTQTHKYTEWYKISVIEMPNTVIYPCCKRWSRKLYVLINDKLKKETKNRLTSKDNFITIKRGVMKTLS